jgi:hypothetical protein
MSKNLKPKKIIDLEKQSQNPTQSSFNVQITNNHSSVIIKNQQTTSLP